MIFTWPVLQGYKLTWRKWSWKRTWIWAKSLQNWLKINKSTWIWTSWKQEFLQKQENLHTWLLVILLADSRAFMTIHWTAVSLSSKGLFILELRCSFDISINFCYNSTQSVPFHVKINLMYWNAANNQAAITLQ